MSVRLRIDGLDALQRELREASQEIRSDAMGHVRHATESAAGELRQRLGRHRVTGRLQGSVTTSYPADDVLVGVARVTAPHAHLFMWGTRKNRHVRGTNQGRYRGANRGRMPRADRPTIVDIARRWRTVMIRDLVAMLRGKGYEVAD